MADKTWKANERSIASFFGTTRNSLSGMGSKHSSSDTLHPNLYIEAKYRKKHTTWSLWEDTKKKAKKESKTPVVVLKEAGKQGELIVCHSKDFLAVADEIRKGDVDAEKEAGG